MIISKDDKEKTITLDLTEEDGRAECTTFDIENVLRIVLKHYFKLVPKEALLIKSDKDELFFTIMNHRKKGGVR